MELTLVNVVGFVAVWTLFSIPFGILMGKFCSLNNDRKDEEE